MAHTNLGKSANTVLTAADINKCLAEDGSGNFGIGNSSPAKDLDVTGEIRASTGILFGNDTASANTLDDYEEGSWTPVINANEGTGTTFSSSGAYTKIGNIVHIVGYFGATNGTLVATVGGGMNITGLPFAPESSFNYVGTHINQSDGGSLANSIISGATNSISNLTINVASGKNISISGTYRV